MAIERALSGDPSFDLRPETTERFFEEAIKGPLLKTFERDIEPRIRSGFSQLGTTFSTRRDLAVQQALGDVGDVLARELSTAQFSNQRLEAQLAESAAQRQIQGVGLAEQFEAAPLRRAAGLFAAASPFQQFEQQRIDREMQEFLRTRPELSPIIPQALSFVGQRQAQAVPTGGGGGGGFAGAGGLLAGLLLPSLFPPAAGLSLLGDFPSTSFA